MSQRYSKLFEKSRTQRSGAFIPFVTLGDPTPEESGKILETLIRAGADALELGIPFSDPVADGPVIQASANRALDAGATPDLCLELLAEARAKHPDIPFGLLVYANLAIGKGLERFYRRAAESGVDSVLVADVPIQSARPFVRAAEDAGIDPVFVVPPNAADEKLREIARMSKGYTYFLGRSGVTGADREAQAPLASRIALLKEAGAPPVVVGFGISRPDHVRACLAAGADGAIAGSATVAIVAENLSDPEKTRAELSRFVGSMKAAAASA
jgi:tryptophan synthase alpha chain